MIQPKSLSEIQQACIAHRQFLPVGGQTKAALTVPESCGVTLIDMRAFAGIVSYDPSEFLITMRGGTTIEELSEVLGARGQYLPFDPVLSSRGATIGGSIASGISGPCRMLYGSLRDFMMEVALCDSQGREIRGGGKVVKNAAGFDLPKLVVGSYGRMGIITEATLKVFPRPQGWLTLKYSAASLKAALETSMNLLALPLPIAAMEIEEPNDVVVRLAGPLDSLDGMAARIIAHLPARHQVVRIEPGQAELAMWHDRSQFAWASGHELIVRVAVAHHQCAELVQALSRLSGSFRRTLSCGASVCWISAASRDSLPDLENMLSELKLPGVVVSGSHELTLLGDQRWVATAHRIQKALDPDQKLPAYQASIAATAG